MPPMDYKTSDMTGGIREKKKNMQTYSTSLEELRNECKRSVREIKTSVGSEKSFGKSWKTKKTVLRKNPGL